MNEAAVSRKLRLEVEASDALCWKISDRFHGGRPDLMLIYKGRPLFIEVKVHPNKPTSLQWLELGKLFKQGVQVAVLTYFPKQKRYELFWNIQLASFTTIKDLSAWLLKYLCSNTSEKQSNT